VKRSAIQDIRITLSAVLLILFGFGGLNAQSVKDGDGNQYSVVTIGKQVWMTENLKTTKYADGIEIQLAADDKKMQDFTPSYSWFNNDETANKGRYGALYNWYAVSTKKLCPQGWHVPSDADWTILTDFLTAGAYGHEGSGNDIAKSMAAKAGWIASSEPGSTGNYQKKSNNRSGFSALPGGIRNFTGKPDTIGSYAFWWSATEFYTTNAWTRGLIHNKAYVFRLSYGKRNHMSVRCIKD